MDIRLHQESTFNKTHTNHELFMEEMPRFMT